MSPVDASRTRVTCGALDAEPAEVTGNAFPASFLLARAVVMDSTAKDTMMMPTQMAYRITTTLLATGSMTSKPLNMVAMAMMMALYPLPL